MQKEWYGDAEKTPTRKKRLMVSPGKSISRRDIGGNSTDESDEEIRNEMNERFVDEPDGKSKSDELPMELDAAILADQPIARRVPPVSQNDVPD